MVLGPFMEQLYCVSCVYIVTGPNENPAVSSISFMGTYNFLSSKLAHNQMANGQSHIISFVLGTPRLQILAHAWDPLFLYNHFLSLTIPRLMLLFFRLVLVLILLLHHFKKSWDLQNPNNCQNLQNS